MDLTKEARKLYQQLGMIEEETLHEGSDIWKRKMSHMKDSEAKAYYELFEELEAEGLIAMSIEEREGQCPIPKKIWIKHDNEDDEI